MSREPATKGEGPAPRPVPLAALFGTVPETDPRPPPPAPDELRAEGYAAGLAAARAEAAEAAARAADAHALALRTADEAARAILAAAAVAMADVALAVARAVLAAEPMVPRPVVERLLADVLAHAPAGAAGRLRVHPDGLGLVDAAIPDGWTLVGDLSLPPGTVIADLGAHAVTASLADRLATIAEHLGTTP
jgi:flagellar assembly protein FliH